MKKGTALLIGVLIVSVLMMIALTVSVSALHTLKSGTNIADWEIARQAAETGIENALLYLDEGYAGSNGFTPDELKNNLDVETGRPIISPLDSASSLTDCRTEPTGVSACYNRRDMNEVTSPPYPTCASGEGYSDPPVCDHWVTLNYPSEPIFPKHQYWNYKIWRNPEVPGAGTWTIWSSYIAQALQSDTVYRVNKTDTALAYLDNANNYYISPDGEYNAQFILGQPSFPSGAPTSTPTNIVLRLWMWADDCTNIVEGYDPTNNYYYPIAQSKSGIVCQSTGVQVAGMMAKDINWSSWSSAAQNSIYMADAQEIGNPSPSPDYQYGQHFHVYYTLDPDAVFDKPVNYTPQVQIAKEALISSPETYTIDAIGMYGQEKIHLRAMLDPNSMRYWRINYF